MKELLQELKRAYQEHIILLNKEALLERREFFLIKIKRKLKSHLKDIVNNNSSDVQYRWIAISSLSGLRKYVKGRFSTIKDYWVNCGLPLKSKKGEVINADISIDAGAFIKMQEWLLKQGIECRKSESKDAFFEIKVGIK